MNESFIKISRTCVKYKVDPGLELQKALAGVIGLIGSISLSLCLALPTSFINNNNIWRSVITGLLRDYRAVTSVSSERLQIGHVRVVRAITERSRSVVRAITERSRQCRHSKMLSRRKQIEHLISINNIYISFSSWEIFAIILVSFINSYQCIIIQLNLLKNSSPL